MKFYIPLAVLVALAGVWFFSAGQSIEVETVTPVRTKAVQAVYATGTVEAAKMIPIAPKVGARLLSLAADEGAKVEQGEILAQLEATDLEGTLKSQEAQQELAQKEFARAEKLWKTKAISRTAYDQAQTELAAAQAAVERAKAELSYLQLTAPEAGTVIRRDGEIGEFIAAGTNVFWMSGGNAMRIETEVDEEDIGLVEIGQRVIIRADAFPQSIFEGQVQTITPKGDPVARSYRVRVSLPENTPLLIGMTAETNIITQTKDDAMMVPAAAVSEGRIIKIQDGKAMIADVTTGIKTPQAVEILGGLAEQEIIAEKFNSMLVEQHIKSKDKKEWLQTE